MQSRRNALGTGLKDILLSMDMGNLSSDALARATHNAREGSQSGRVRASELKQKTSPRDQDLMVDLKTLLKFCGSRMTQWEISRCEEWYNQLGEGRGLSEKQEALVISWIDKYVNGEG